MQISLPGSGHNSNLLYHVQRMKLMECKLLYNQIETHYETTCFVRSLLREIGLEWL